MSTVFRSLSRRPPYRLIETTVIDLLNELGKKDVDYLDYPLFEEVADRLNLVRTLHSQTKRQFIFEALSRSPRFVKETREYDVPDHMNGGKPRFFTEKAFILIAENKTES